MRFVETPLHDAFRIELDSKKDNRGSFSRLFCSDLFKENGLANHSFVQVNLSENSLKGTLRGLHFQAEPHLEAKIVYCLAGKVFDVMVDLRKTSATYLQHFGLILSAEQGTAVFIPKGFAHGFLTLENHSSLLYLMSDSYKPGFERGYRYDDPAFGIEWPMAPTLLSERDQNYPAFEEAHALT